uniref:Uncharacterized protein n=1 Tax=mine drainage metagenome TaxID=410659 RepID=E6QCE0_9ZZZZ
MNSSGDGVPFDEMASMSWASSKAESLKSAAGLTNFLKSDIKPPVAPFKTGIVWSTL